MGILQHFEGQQIIHELRPVILEAVINNIDRPLSSMWQFAPGSRYFTNEARIDELKNVYYMKIT